MDEVLSKVRIDSIDVLAAFTALEKAYYKFKGQQNSRTIDGLKKLFNKFSLKFDVFCSTASEDRTVKVVEDKIKEAHSEFAPMLVYNEMYDAPQKLWRFINVKSREWKL